MFTLTFPHFTGGPRWFNKERKCDWKRGNKTALIHR